MSQHDGRRVIQSYQRLIDISHDLASTLELDVLLHRIVNAAADICDAEAASILLFDQEKGLLFFQSSTNLDRPMMRGLVVPVESSIAGWIAVNREPLIVNDPQNDPRFYQDIQEEANFPTRTLLGVPMIAKDSVIGVLEVLNKRDGAFVVADQELLMTLGAQAAVAIENARLFHQTDLIAEMVHEFRTPLGSLNAATHILLRPDLAPDKHKQMVMIIQQETQRLSEMASSFLNLARLESGRTRFEVASFEPVMLLGECAGITRSSMLTKNLRLIWQVPEKLPILQGDQDKMKQVFLNLLSNAVKYNFEGGEITVSAGAKEGTVWISVGDTGPGIPPESIERLFEKFFRVPGTEKMASGTGLGLSICRKIVEAHGGKIEVVSQPGEGTVFTVHLPVDDNPLSKF